MPFVTGAMEPGATRRLPTATQAYSTVPITAVGA